MKQNAEFKTRSDGVGKVIHCECASDHIAKWYMYQPQSFLENETHEIMGDFEIQTDLPLPDRISELVFIKEKKMSLVEVYRSRGP